MTDEMTTWQGPLEREVRRYLKPCPFCGDPEINYWDLDDGLAANGRWEIECDGCDMTMTVWYELVGREKQRAWKLILKKWNRRA